MVSSSGPRAAHSVAARLQQLAVICLVSLAAFGGGLLWPSRPWLAVAVGSTVLAVHSLVIGLEFLLLPWLGRTDPAPRPLGSMLVAAWIGESVQYLLAFGWRQPFRWRAIPDRLEGEGTRGRRGVVLVHGFCCNRGFWNPWLMRLARDQRAFIAVNLEPVFGSIDRYGTTIDQALARVEAVTGLAPLLVCHSMGGLAARAWLAERDAKDAPRQDRVHRVVTIGSPHRGTWLARFSGMTNGRQMREDSDWLRALTTTWEVGRAGLPCHRFTCWYSNTDNIVMPHASATLDGADNRLIRGVGHVALAQTAEVMERTLAYLEESA